MDEDPGNIIPFVVPVADPEAPFQTKRAPVCPKACKRVVADVHSRSLQCRDCGRWIDPFDYVHEWAQQCDGRLGWLRRAKEEYVEKMGEVEKLKREIANLKAQKRRLLDSH